MENTASFWTRKHLAIAGIAVLVIAGSIFGAGKYLRGSFTLPSAQNATIPSPTNVHITQDANGKYILNWDYVKENEDASHYFYTVAGVLQVHQAAFEWFIADKATGNAIWTPDVSKAVSPDNLGAGASCNPILTNDVTNTVDTDPSFVCHDVFVDDVAAAKFVPGGQYVLKVRADTGIADAGGVSQLSPYGVGEFDIPAPQIAAPTDPTFVMIDLQDGTFSWNGPALPSPANSLFTPPAGSPDDSYYYAYGWEIFDVTDRDVPAVSVFKKDVYGSAGTNPKPASGMGANCLKTVVDPADATKQVSIWTCDVAYIPKEAALVSGHWYEVRVTMFNGAASSTAVASPSVMVPAIAPLQTPDILTVDTQTAAGEEITFNYGWNDRGIVPDALSSKLTDSTGAYQFAFGWTLKDESGATIWQKPKDANGVVTAQALPAAFQSCVQKLSDTVIYWTCQSGFIPKDEIAKLDSTKKYTLSVYAYNGNETTSLKESAPFGVKAVMTKPANFDAVGLKNTDELGRPNNFVAQWLDRGYEPTVDNSLYTVGGKPVFTYTWKITDVTDPKNLVVVLDKGEFDDVGNENVVQDSLLTPSCFVKLDGVSGKKAWICADGFIDDGLKFYGGHSYLIRVSAGNGVGMNDGIGMTFKIPDLGALPAPTDVKVSSSMLDDAQRYELSWSYPNDISAQSHYGKMVGLMVLPNPPPVSFGRFSIFNWTIEDSAGKIVWTPDMNKVEAGVLAGSNVSCVDTLTHDITKAVKTNVFLCHDVYIDDAVIKAMSPSGKYIIKVWADNGLVDGSGKAILSPAGVGTFTAPAAPATAAVSNLTAKKQADGSVAVSYTVTLGGTQVAPSFTSEVRVGASKDFATKFNEVRKDGVTSYNYQAVLMPWEIKDGDKITVAVASADLAAESTSSIDYHAAVIESVALAFSGTSLPGAQVGVAYNASVGAVGGVLPYKFTVVDASSVPAGLSVAGGIVSGTPTVAGSYSLKMNVVDNAGTVVAGVLSLNVASATVVVVNPPAAGGVAYSSGCYGPCGGSGSGGGTIIVVKPVVVDPLRFTFVFNYLTAKFRDIQDHWAKSYISALYNAGIVKGYSSMKFGPDDSVTRAQLLKVVLESLKYPVSNFTGASSCYDVPAGAWYGKYFAAGKKYGIVSGYDDGSCKPNKSINRAEAVKILFGAVAKMPWHAVNDVSVVGAAGMKSAGAMFHDVIGGSWYYPTFDAAVKYGIIQGFGGSNGGEGRPEGELSRGQLAKIMVVTLQRLSGVTVK